ncbi:MAG: hypothetical protein ACYDCK_04970 [Thermoplasmatota archaeon]
MTLWRYHASNHHHGVPSEAWLDNFSGRVTKAWKYVGKEFDLNTVPHGDLTYPSISTADILASSLARMMPADVPFAQFENIAVRWLIDHKSEGCYVTTDSVNELDEDHIVPTLPHAVRAELHHPHPVLFVYDELFAKEDKDAIENSEFHALARKWAFNKHGCVVRIVPGQFPTVVRRQDRIVFTPGSDSKICQALADLNPTKRIEVEDSRQFFKLMLKE